MFRMYKQKREGGYENKIIYGETLEELQKIGNSLNPVEYYSYLIVKNEGNGDEPVGNFKVSEPVKVEFVDKDPTNIEIKTHVFKPSKMKQKEELRRMTQDYIDR